MISVSWYDCRDKNVGFRFNAMSQPAMDSTQFPILWLSSSFSGDKAAKAWSYHSHIMRNLMLELYPNSPHAPVWPVFQSLLVLPAIRSQYKTRINQNFARCFVQRRKLVFIWRKNTGTGSRGARVLKRKVDRDRRPYREFREKCVQLYNEEYLLL